MPKKITQKKSAINIKILVLIFSFISIAWAFYRSNFYYSIAYDEIIFKPLIWLLPLLLLVSFQKLDIKSFNFYLPKVSELAIGFFLGILLALWQLIPRLTNTPLFLNFYLPTPFLPTLALLATAITEEILFRGFFLQQLVKRYPQALANLITSIAFSLIHLPILLQTTNNLILIGLLVIGINSFVFGWIFLRTKNLWPPILAHFIADIILSFF